MDQLEALKKARALLSKPGKWTTGAFARNRSGKSLDDGFAAGATCFCAMGAVEKVTGEPIYGPLATQCDRTLRTVLVDMGHGESIPEYNDSRRSVNSVLRLFDRAIAKLEKAK